MHRDTQTDYFFLIQRIYFIIKKYIFFNSNVNIRFVLSIVYKKFIRVFRLLLLKSNDVSKNNLRKIYQFNSKCDFLTNKLWEQIKIVQINETMLNYRFKSYRGCFFLNKTDCIFVEWVDRIKWVLTIFILDKIIETIIK